MMNFETDDDQRPDSKVKNKGNNENAIVKRAPLKRRYIRNAEDPFEVYSDEEFKKRYRFSKDVIKNGILPKLEKELKKPTNRGLPFAPVLQLLMTLRYYATANYQLVVEDIIPVSQPTASRTVIRISKLILNSLRECIKMPTTEEDIAKNNKLFEVLGFDENGIGIPGIDGVISCIHIRLAQTKFQKLKETFKNHEGYYSLKVQTVVGPHMEFMDIGPLSSGKASNMHILEKSSIYRKYVDGECHGFLLGDANYPCTPFIMTPVQQPTTEKERAYNNIHQRTRQVIERTYGVWKRRFPCLTLGLSSTKLEFCITIASACAVLHNMALEFKDDLPNDRAKTEESDRQSLSEPV